MCCVSKWAWPAEERKCRWAVRTTVKKKSVREAVHETKVTNASNPMNVARVILVLIFCTLFITSYFTNKVNWLYYTLDRTSVCLSCCFGLHLLNAIIVKLTGTIIHNNVQLFFALQYILSILKFTFPTIFQGYVFIFVTLFLGYNQNSVPHLHDISIFIFYLSLSLTLSRWQTSTGALLLLVTWKVGLVEINGFSR